MSVPSRSLPSSTNVASLLGLPGPGAYLVFGVYATTIGCLAIAAGGQPMRSWSGWLSLAIALAAAALVVTKPGYPLSLPSTLAAVAATSITSVLVPLELDGRLAAGYAAWYLLANTLILLALSVRGRIIAAWVGFLLMTAATAVWTTTDGAGPLTGLLMVERESVAIVAGSLYAIALRRLIRRRAALEAVEIARAADAHADDAAAQERRAQMRRFDEDVRSSLAEIASGRDLTATVRATYAALEGALRDQIRGRALSAEPLVESVLRARLRGIDVLLLDDTSIVDIDSAVQAELASAVAAIVDDTAAGSVVARVTSDGSTYRTSVVVTLNGEVMRHERFEILAQDRTSPTP